MKFQMSFTVYPEVPAIVWSSSLVAQSSCWKMCISKPTSSENTFEEISCSVKYLRAILLITDLFLNVFDGTASTLNKANEYMKT